MATSIEAKIKRCQFEMVGAWAGMHEYLPGRGGGVGVSRSIYTRDRNRSHV